MAKWRNVILKIEKLDEVNVKITSSEPAIIKEISDKFSFLVPGAQFDFRVKNGWWNGKKTLFNQYKKLFYIGLVPKLIEWLNESSYEYELDHKLNSYTFSIKEAQEFIDTLNLPFKPRSYQIKYFIKAIRSRRLLCLSPTSSGKSLIIYLIFRYLNKKTLLIVPQLSLLPQLFKDFKSYGYEVEKNVHLVHGGIEKTTDKILTISTWHSLTDMPSSFFNQFEILLGDEAHTFKANSLVTLMNKTKKTKIKIGFTGTLSGNHYDDSVVEGLFGQQCRYITTKEMMDKNFSSELFIKVILLYHKNYTDDLVSYENELKYLFKNEVRNKFIKNLTLSLKGNTFVMFRFREHGKLLYDAIKAQSDYPVYYVDGDTTVDEREKIREAIENHENSITIASTVFATGINITTINNIIFASPSKGRIKVLQSIGRGLRRNDNKHKMMLFDISDKFHGVLNYTFNHMKERLQLYKNEKFSTKIYRVDI